jgi:hypothetical protein
MTKMSAEVRAEVIDQLTQMLTRLGAEPEQAAKGARVLTDMADAQRSGQPD